MLRLRGGGGGASPLSAFSQTDLLEVDDYSDFYRGGVVQGDNTSFVYISRDYLLNYDKMGQLFATEPLLTGAPWQRARSAVPGGESFGHHRNR